ncbi:unnamed protein product [Chrysoparadoxa australica]
MADVMANSQDKDKRGCLTEAVTKHSMKLISSHEATHDKQASHVIDAGQGRVWTLEEKSGGGFTACTENEFLLDNLFIENIEEQLLAAGDYLSVLACAREVYECIAGGGGGKDDDDEGEDLSYEYDNGEAGMSIEADGGSRKKNKATGDWVNFDEDLPGIKRAKNMIGSGNTRLMRDLSRMMRIDTDELGFSLELKDEDNLHCWRVKLSGFTDCPLADDMVRLKKEKNMDHIELEMSFQKDYPYSPPFVRVVFPRFVKGTGYILSGGFCFELLTMQGWAPSYDIEAVLIHIRSQMIVGKARIDFSATQPYDESKSRNAFVQAAKYHKWPI